MPDLIVPKPPTLSPEEQAQFDREVAQLTMIVNATVARLEPDARVIRAAFARVLAAHVVDDWACGPRTESRTLVNVRARDDFAAALASVWAMWDKLTAPPSNDEPGAHG